MSTKFVNKTEEEKIDTGTSQQIDWNGPGAESVET